jgi:predicted MFS family arabinose efflux permease
VPKNPIDLVLGDGIPTEVRRHVGLLTLARLAANSCFRFAPPFLATIARGTDVTLEQIGVAVAIAELAGLLSPLTARIVDRMTRRRAMVLGLFGVAIGTAVTATSTGLVQFVIGLVTLGQSKVMFDLGLGSWVTDHVPDERRGRVVGLTETSWAGGLLLGVSTMGLVTGVFGWRVGYAFGAIVVVLMAAAVARRLPTEPHHTEVTARAAASAGTSTDRRLEARGWWAFAATGCLMAAVQSVFVTFGSWLEDSFDFTATMLSAVAFGIGIGELVASVGSARRTDAWGKERSVAMGAALMVPAAIGVALWHEQLWVGLPLLVVAILGFEFAIVSSIPIGLSLVPSSPAWGLGMMLAAGTTGRALASIPATRLYEDRGMAWPAIMTAVLAAGCVLSIGNVARLSKRVTAGAPS